MTALISLPTNLASSPSIPTVADLLDRLGGIPASRVRYWPLPGTATEQDVIDIEAREGRLCELVDGVLVEKTMGFEESLIGGGILTELNNFVRPRKLGLVTGADGMVRLFPGMVRIPDVAFVSRQTLPGGRKPVDRVPALAPDLVVEVLSEGNTVPEMTRKANEYFDAGVKLLWIVDPPTKTVTVYTSVADFQVLTESETLDGGDVLSGFTLAVQKIFADPLA